MASTLYIHWTATGYDWIRPGDYHSIIAGDGRLQRLHAYSVAVSCACMGDQHEPFEPFAL